MGTSPPAEAGGGARSRSVAGGSGDPSSAGAGSEPAGPGRRTLVDPRTLAGDAFAVAPGLLHKLLVCGDRAVRIVEVEAYGGADDPASHAFRGRTARNGSMFGPPGHLYVYFIYGNHWCANVVCGSVGDPQAVLVRAGIPMAGVDQMVVARAAARRVIDLANGPGKLCQALGIDGQDDGTDLTDARSRVRLEDDGYPRPGIVASGPRIGIRAATDRRWRWWVAGDPNVSAAGPTRPRSR